MRCGRLSATKATPAGSGMPSITTPARSWPLSLVGVRIQCFCNGKLCWNPLGSHNIIPSYWGAYTRRLDPEEQHPGQAQHAENRAQAPDVTHTHETLGP